MFDVTDLEWVPESSGRLSARLVVGSEGAAYLRVGMKVAALPPSMPPISPPKLSNTLLC